MSGGVSTAVQNKVFQVQFAQEMTGWLVMSVVP